jgi:alkanesulfonate monooxygenase SsuD/methylene tetrahydromethanopterin reductase-like flavin-dependent oxidoreductase (luciferase family)
VREVQRLWLEGDRDAARRRVPTAIGLGTNLVGTDDDIRARLRLYRDVGITTLRAGLPGEGLHARLDALGHLLDLVGDLGP